MYLPDVDRPAYSSLLAVFGDEFTYAFGGCSIIRGVDGAYLSRIGVIVRDRVNLLYTDVPFTFRDGFQVLSDYADELREVALRSLEAILVVVYPVYHSQATTVAAPS